MIIRRKFPGQIIAIVAGITLSANAALSFASDSGADPTPQQVIASLSSLGKMYIASDATRGLIYAQKLENNPGGKIFVLNSAGEKQGEIYVSSPMVRTPESFELQLGKNGNLYYLVKGKRHRSIGAIIPSSEAPDHWKHVEADDGLGGMIRLQNLRAEADGRMSVEGYDLKTRREVVAVFDPAVSETGEKPEMQLHVASVVSLATVNGLLRNQSTLKSEAAASSGDAPAVAGTGVGFTAGWITGLGFMYRQYFENGWGAHVGAVAYGDANSFSFNVGTELLKTLHQTRISRLYALAGAGVYFSSYTVFDHDPASTPPIGDGSGKPVQTGGYSQKSTDYNFGAGVGIELGVQRGIHVAVELPLVVSLNKTDGVAGGLKLSKIGPLPSISLIYYIR